MLQRVGLMVTSLFLMTGSGNGQDITTRIDQAVKILSADIQFSHATIGLYVVDTKTGRLVFDKNSQLGMAPASCQKLITSASAFELLGRSYKFKTYIDRDAPIKQGKLQGNLYLTGNGDPTLGSDRWSASKEAVVLEKILNTLQQHKITTVAGDLVCNDSHFAFDPLPGGWVWEDIGNYYGVGAWGFNWKENQFDITFKTGRTKNDSTSVLSTDPASMMTAYTFANFVTTGIAGSGDNAYLFSAPFLRNIIARGTVPVSSAGFTISGSMPDPPYTFLQSLQNYLRKNSVAVTGSNWSCSEMIVNNKPVKIPPLLHLDSIVSPPLDSINYWFLKKSVNLFGEALVKTIAYEKSKPASTDSGISIIKNYWSARGIEPAALKIIDGSGLSPANRLTCHSLVTVLQYAKNQEWFGSFYNALPETNGIKMKDGYITGVRSYAGYLKSTKGNEYSFAFIVNNFDGSPGKAREKIWQLLNILKDY